MSIRKKLYEDFFKKSRLKDYKNLLQVAKNNGYCMMGILDFYKYLTNGKIDCSKKIIINRHDVDTSPKVARLMFEIEQEVYGKDGSATYYFRDCTMNKKLITDIISYGYEAGYHYETIANYEKKHKLKSADKIRLYMKDIEKCFSKEFDNYKRKTQSTSLTVSSHGDFVNVKNNIQNLEVLKNEELRKNNGIIVEAYDESINKFVEKRFADQQLVENFCQTVIDNLNVRVIQILTHPRQWKVDFWWNLKDLFRRIIEGIKYKL